MRTWMICCWAGTLLALAGLIGCTGGGGDGKKDKEASSEEKEIKAQFEKLQKALDERDSEKIWAFMDKKSHEKAEEAAKEIKEAYGKADAKGKAEMEKDYTFVEIDKKSKDFGKKDTIDLASLTSKTVLRTRKFHDAYHEVEEAKFDKAVIKGNNATVHYTEDEGKKQTLGMTKEKGEWKAFLPVPH